MADAYQIVKAFSTYFELTNLAETNHRKRRQRAARLVPAAPDKPGSLRGTLRRMQEAGDQRREALAWLRRVEVTPVFTAHPTEVARRVVHFKQRRIARELEELDRLPLTDGEAVRGQRPCSPKSPPSGRPTRCGGASRRCWTRSRWGSITTPIP